MIILIKETIIGQLLGNIYGFIKSKLVKEEPVWVSDFMYKNGLSKGFGSYVFFAFFIFFLPLLYFIISVLEIPTNEYFYYPDFNNVPLIFKIELAFFFVSGGLLLLASINWLDKIWIFKDRIEIRLFYNSYKIIPFTSIRYVLRDKTSGSNAHIIYDDPSYGLWEIGHKESKWKIPVNIFKELGSHFSEKKLSPNLFVAFESIADKLLESPIIREKTPLFSEMPLSERILILLLK